MSSRDGQPTAAAHKSPYKSPTPKQQGTKAAANSAPSKQQAATKIAPSKQQGTAAPTKSGDSVHSKCSSSSPATTKSVDKKGTAIPVEELAKVFKSVFEGETTATTSKKHTKKAASKKQPTMSSKEKPIEVSRGNKSNPKFKFGQPMLSASELRSVGPATRALHAHYMKCCKENNENEVMVMFKRSHFLIKEGKYSFSMGLNDLYDLFKMDGLSLPLVRCFTL